MNSEITNSIAQNQSDGNHAPNDERINTVLSPSASHVFTQYLKTTKTTASDLLNEIIHAWAAHPARTASVIPLPLETSVVYKDEPLAQYLTRVSIAVIEAVLKSKNGNFAEAARSLHCDRSALHHRLKRLTTANQSLTSFQCIERNVNKQPQNSNPNTRNWTNLAWFVMDYQDFGDTDYTRLLTSEPSARNYIEQMHEDNWDQTKGEFKDRRGFELAILYEFNESGQLIEIDQYSTASAQANGDAKGWQSH